jgi:hypothetical protein
MSSEVIVDGVMSVQTTAHCVDVIVLLRRNFCRHWGHNSNDMMWTLSKIARVDSEVNYLDDCIPSK